MTKTQVQGMQLHNKACKFQQNNNKNIIRFYLRLNTTQINSTTNQSKILRQGVKNVSIMLIYAQCKTMISISVTIFW